MKRGLTRAQQKLRDKLLRDSGFVDLEDEDGAMKQATTLVLGDHGTRRSQGRYEARLDEIETTAEYYRRASQLLHEHSWRSPVERRIWELHTEAASYTRIWRTVRREMEQGQLPREKMYRRRVHAVVTRTRAILMGKAPKKRGRRVDPDSLRSHGMVLRLRVAPSHALALDHIRAVLRVSRSDVVRMGLELLKRSIR